LVVQVQKLGIQGRSSTEAGDTGLVQYWICGFKAGSGSGTKTVKVQDLWKLTRPCKGAEDSVLVLYRRCGYRWKKELKRCGYIAAVHSTVQKLWIEAWCPV
jgi:hypothetical protein